MIVEIEISSDNIEEIVSAMKSEADRMLNNWNNTPEGEDMDLSWDIRDGDKIIGKVELEDGKKEYETVCGFENLSLKDWFNKYKFWSSGYDYCVWSYDLIRFLKGKEKYKELYNDCTVIKPRKNTLIPLGIMEDYFKHYGE
jgi:hypothetical protein